MFSCDYNGWTDVREEEREAIESFEASLLAFWYPRRVVSLVPSRPVPAPPRSKAA